MVIKLKLINVSTHNAVISIKTESTKSFVDDKMSSEDI
jgi:hypothetical protein